ncbi:MAG: NAD(P)-binding domain-containing protein [Bacteroidia bacterium]|nr:NAD(P)-binding domain-containing protein [Bacteroidia bacterium]
MFKAILLDSVHPVLHQILQQKGIMLVDMSRYSEEKQRDYLKDTDILIVRSKQVNKNIMDCAPKLRIIGRAGSGMENIDVSYAETRGIKCFNSPEGNRDSVGEHAIGMLLMLLHKLNKADREVRNNIWDRKNNWGDELMGKTIGIIGYGNTGSRFAKKLSGFDCTLLVYDKYKNNINDYYVKQAELKEIYEHADIVSIHLPLNQETHYYADEHFFNQFKKNIYFINTSRGKILKTSALVNALKSGKVQGACLDVIEYEDSHFESMNAQSEEDFEYLKKSEKVVLTPHIAGWSYQSYEKICQILAEKIICEIHSWQSVS